MRKVFLIIIILYISISSCQKPEPFPVDYIGNEAAFGALKVSVRYIYRISPEISDSSVSDANIRIYTSALDRDDEINRLAERNTDALGRVAFESVETGIVYLRIRHPRFGVLDDSLQIIPGTTSFVEVDYY